MFVMRLDGYKAEDITPWEDASGGKAVGCDAANAPCTASLVFKGPPGWYDLDVQYFDENTGVARFQLLVGDQRIQSWTADRSLPSKMPDGDTSTRERITEISLRPNDRIRIVGVPSGGDNASLDYVEIRPHTN